MTIFHLIHLVKYMFSILPIAIEYEFCTRTQLLLLLLLWLNNLVIHRMYNPVSSWFFCGNYFTSGRKEGRKRRFFCKYFFSRFANASLGSLSNQLGFSLYLSFA